MFHVKHFQKRSDEMKTLNNDLNIEFTKGDTFSFGLVLHDLGQELEGAYFTCRQNYDDTQFLFQKSIDNGITFVGAETEDYTYRVRIAPEDTENLEAGKYYYDLQIEANGDVYTLMKGILTLEFDVTRGGGL